MYKLSMGLNAERLMEDILAVRNSIVDAKSYQNADYGIIMSNLDDIIDMCTYAITNGYGGD